MGGDRINGCLPSAFDQSPRNRGRCSGGVVESWITFKKRCAQAGTTSQKVTQDLLPSPLPSNSRFKMCIPFTHYHEHPCGHMTLVSQQVVDCNKSYCRFSRSHMPEPHVCATTCTQSMMPEQSMIERVSTPCAACGGRINGR